MEYSTALALTDIAIIYAIVIVVSLLIAVVIKVIVTTLSRRADNAAATAAKLAPVAVTPVPVSGIPPDHLVAIAAAVMAMSGAHRIVRIQSSGQSYAWTATGRTQHHGSHRPRRP
ncbi:MAG: hypothetical protein EA356_00890 [Geminicoccaceae bacterium]|nr:MAG: hypothetical protein EA356_00890 [Geminicoccaceae bacterium]